MHSNDAAAAESDLQSTGAPAITLDQTVAAHRDLEWQIMLRVARRGIKASRELDDEKSD